LPPLLSHLPPLGQDKDLLAVIETPKGSPNKYKYEETYGGFRLNTVMPKGSIWPYDFGFIPSTVGEDGDPLDVLILMDEPAPLGCLVSIRLVGAIEAKQREKDGNWERNDRLLAISTQSLTHVDIHDVDDLGSALLDEIEQFFANYTSQRCKTFKPIGRIGAKKARKIVENVIAAFDKRRKSLS
jgi:inorganic pyrophosphatase